MNPIIQADVRCIRQKDIPEIMELYHFVQELDKKYGVNSSDFYNSFGIVQPERMLISELYTANLWFNLFGYRSKSDGVPKYRYETVSYPEQGILIGGRSKKVDLIVDPSDIKRLQQLRESAKEAGLRRFPRKPVYSNTTASNCKEYDSLLKEQGFADGTKTMHRRVKAGPHETDIFEIEYSRCGSNRAPHFTTSYQGWQNQEQLDRDSIAYSFYKKWNPFHCIELTMEEYCEMLSDANEVCQAYN